MQFEVGLNYILLFTRLLRPIELIVTHLFEELTTDSCSHADGVMSLSSVTDEKKYFQKTRVRQLKTVETQHAGEHRESRLFRLQQILRILHLTSCCKVINKQEPRQNCSD